MHLRANIWGSLQCSGFVKHGEDKRSFFKKLFNVGGPRAPPSGSDPSALVRPLSRVVTPRSVAIPIATC